MSLQRIILASAVSALVAAGAMAPAGAQTPTARQLYEMLLKQQKQIRALQLQLRRANRLLRQRRGAVNTHQSAIDAQKAAAAARAAARRANAAIVKLRRDGTPVGSKGRVTLTLSYAKQDGVQSFASVVLLKPSHELLGFGIFSADGGTPSTISGSSVISVKTDFAPGVRAGFGYGFPGTGVDIRAMFTWLQGDWSRSANATAPASILSTLVNPAASGFDDAFNANARYGFEYFVADLEVAQSLVLGRSLLLRFLAGLRMARISDELDVLYQNRNFGPQGNRVVINNRFTGVGPRFGAEATWRIFGSFFMGASFDASLLLGNYTFRTRETFLDGGFVISTFDEKQRGVIVPAFGARLVVGWKGQIRKGLSLVVELGYEFQSWVGLIRNVNGVDDINGASLQRQSSNLLLHGPFLMLKLKFDNLGMLFGR